MLEDFFSEMRAYPGISEPPVPVGRCCRNASVLPAKRCQAAPSGGRRRKAAEGGGFRSCADTPTPRFADTFFSRKGELSRIKASKGEWPPARALLLQRLFP